MTILLMMVLALQVAVTGSGKKEGRQGNAQYAQEQYQEAADTYRDGIQSVQDSGPGSVHSGLLNNLGASLYRSGDAEQAGVAFASAARMALNPEDLVRASYNAGNAAFQGQQLEQALEHYRRALLTDPTNTLAKYNYEFVKRQLEEQEQQNQDQQDQNQDNQDQEQNEDQQDQDGEQNEDQQDQDQQDENADNQDQNQQDQQDEQQQQDQQREQPDPTKLSEEEAERILQALEQEEEQLLRQVQKMKNRPRRVEKDW